MKQRHLSFAAFRRRANERSTAATKTYYHRLIKESHDRREAAAGREAEELVHAENCRSGIATWANQAKKAGQNKPITPFTKKLMTP